MTTHPSLWLISVMMVPLLAACTGGDDTARPDPVVDTGEPVEDAPSCDDGARNGTETDTDCGGSCDACEVGGGCVTGADCAEGVCDGGACQAAACDDGVRNGAETDIDCGDECGGCSAGDECTAAEDCLDGVCEDGTCQVAECDDGVENGTETDEDCGGDSCGACVRGDSCLDSSDCLDSVCIEQVCERAMFITGTAAGSDAIVGVYTDYEIVRVDFASQPTVLDFDGTPLALPVSDGSFVTSGISPSLDSASVSVAGVGLTSPTGYSYYQSIAPDYYGVILQLDSAASASSSYNTLIAEGLDGQEVEIMILDTSP